MPTELIAVSHETLPGRTRPIALVHLAADAPDAPLSWSEARLHALAATVDSLAEQEVEAMVLVGSTHSFGVGADLDELGAVRDAAHGTEVARIGWQALRRLDALPVPTVALLTGYALGGGLELALFASHRVARADLLGIGLPEARLGLVPGWGGVHRLALLAGPATAIEVALTEALSGRFRGAEAARASGLVDAVIPAEEWESGWRAWLAQLLEDGTPSAAGSTGTAVSAEAEAAPAAASAAGHQPESPHAATSSAAERPDAWAAAVEAGRSGAEALPEANRGVAEAVLDLVARAEHETPDEAEAHTAEVFGRLLAGEDAHAALYADRLLRTRARAPRSASGAAPIGRAAVIGAGLMASQLATLIVQYARIPVTLTDVTAERAAAGVERVRDRLRRAEARGKLPAGDAEALGALVSGTAELADIAGADFVIEAIFEELDAKRAAFAAAEQHIAPHTVLATNTSSLSITAMAAGLAHPDRVVGFHVFNPVSAVPLVEIIATDATAEAPGGTSPETLAAVEALAGRLRRRPVHSADRPGFIVNRVITRLFDTVSRAIDAGADPLEADRALAALSLPMTPLELLDFVGTAVQLHVCHTMHDGYPERFSRPQWLERLVATGAPGNPATALDADGRLTGAMGGALPDPAADSAERVARLLDETLDALAEEVHAMLAEGLVSDVEEIDVALLLGANYPRARGGLTPYLDATGASTRRGGARFHPEP